MRDKVSLGNGSNFVPRARKGKNERCGPSLSRVSKKMSGRGEDERETKRRWKETDGTKNGKPNQPAQKKGRKG